MQKCEQLVWEGLWECSLVAARKQVFSFRESINLALGRDRLRGLYAI
jgi:hypothetical protein